MTVDEALTRFLDQVRRSKSTNTAAAYAQGVRAFAGSLLLRGVNPQNVEIETLSPDWLEWFLHDLHDLSVATERLYTTAISAFYKFVAAHQYAPVNLALTEFILDGRRRRGQRLPVFPEEGLSQVLEFVQALTRQEDQGVDYVNLLRDTALLLTLADTGLRVSEACALRYGDVNWERRQAVVIGKGDKQAVVRFSLRAVRALQHYLSVRQRQAGVRGRISAWPLFARHDRAAGKRILPLSPRSVQKIVDRYVVLALGESARGTITPHTFRHYFVTRVARQHDILLAQHLARHESVSTTEGYAHLTDRELDKAYEEVFGE